MPVKHPVVLALTSSRSQSGKDTLVTQLQARGFNVKRVAFADQMKDELCGLLPSPEEMWRANCDNSMKDYPCMALAIRELPDTAYSRYLRFVLPNDLDEPRSVRWHLQQFGTEYTRIYLKQDSKWLDVVLLQIKHELDSGYDFIVVTDMRETHEYHSLRVHFDALLVRIERDWGNPNVDTAVPHSSDLALRGLKCPVNLWNRKGKANELPTQLLEYLKNA